jgi:WD40 repeat protein
VVRSLDDQSDCFIYRGHAAPTTVAKFSPNGFWVASADNSGKVRVWSWDNPEHPLKLETPVFNGPIRDIDWDFESKKIVAVGEGGTLMAKVFIWDTGNSTGDIVGHNKPVLSVAYKPSRPFKIMTASEDMKTILHTGPPFRLEHSNSVHSNFVNCIRYSPDGSKAVSVGSDKKIQVYDGATGNPIAEVPNAHGASIYSMSFSPDGTRFITASSDKTVKMWDISSLNCIYTQSFADSPQIADMQVGVLWTPLDKMISVSLSGDINILDISSPSKPVHSIQANQVSITCSCLHASEGFVYSGSFDGVIVSTSLISGVSVKLKGDNRNNVSGSIHNGKVVGVSLSGDMVASVGFDDTLRFSKNDVLQSSVSLTGQPSAVACSPSSDVTVVTTSAGVYVFRGQTEVCKLDSLSYAATCVAIFGESEIAVGGDDMKTHIYSIADNTFSVITAIETRSAVSCVSYNPTGEFLAIGDNGRQVEVYERSTWSAKVKGRWVFHTSKITCMAWAPNGKSLASGSFDESIIIWNLDKVGSKTQYQFAHAGGVTSVSWADDQKLISTGNDHAIVEWNIQA